MPRFFPVPGIIAAAAAEINSVSQPVSRPSGGVKFRRKIPARQTGRFA
jgi:hypothetical protein